MIRQILIALIVLSMLTLAPEHPVEVRATSWSSSIALPNGDPSVNNFPILLQTSNFSAGRGTIWLAWEQSCLSCVSSIDLMVHGYHCWGVVTAFVSAGIG